MSDNARLGDLLRDTLGNSSGDLVGYSFGEGGASSSSVVGMKVVGLVLGEVLGTLLEVSDGGAEGYALREMVAELLGVAD